MIVGGGVAGLSAAWKLKKDGFEDFLLLELEQRLGGTSTSGASKYSKAGFQNNDKGVYGYPWGAHYLPVPFKENEDLVALLDEMKLVESRTETGEIVVPEQYLDA